MTDIETWAEHKSGVLAAYIHDDVPSAHSDLGIGPHDEISDELCEALICEAWGLLDEEAVGSGGCIGCADFTEAEVIRRYDNGRCSAWCRECNSFIEQFGRANSVTPILDVRPARGAK